MAQTETKNGASFDERHGEKLSAGRYASKKAYELLITGAGLGLGFFAGRHLAKAKPKWIAKLLRVSEEDLARLPNDEDDLKHITQMGGFFGALFGGAISSLVLAYEHWVKEERTKLSVSEINTDISNILTIREKTSPELIAENDRLREMLEKETQKTVALQKKDPASPQTRVSTEAHESAKAMEAPELKAELG